MKSSGSRWAGFAVALLPLTTLAGAAGLYADLAYAGSGHKPSCAIVGDSIAAGAAPYVSACKVNAKIGIPSGAVIDRVDSSVDLNVVSAGSNDPDNPQLRANLERIRSRAKRVIWILPIDTQARAAVQAVAAVHGDPVVAFAPAGDNVHPLSEVALARSIAAVIAAQS
jgi:hypothetical protein